MSSYEIASLEYKLVPNGNSGVLFHLSEEPVTAWHYAPEAQLLDNLAHPARDKRQLAGALYDLYAPTQDATRPPGQWNQLRIRVQGSHAEHWINGVKVVEYEMGNDDWTTVWQTANSKINPNSARLRRAPSACRTTRIAWSFATLKFVDCLPARRSDLGWR